MTKHNQRNRSRWISLLPLIFLSCQPASPVLALPVTTPDSNPPSHHVYRVSEDSRIRIEGRSLKQPETVTLDHPGSGVHFRANCSGTVQATLKIQYRNAINRLYFTVYVDGKRIGSARGDSLEVSAQGSGLNTYTLTLAQDLPPGEHHIGFYRQNEAGLADIYLESITLENPGELLDPELPRARIEVIGDSLTAGYGVYPLQGNLPYADPYYGDATQSYAFLAAHSLGLEVNLLATSGYGLLAGWGKDNQMRKTYPFTNWFRDSSSNGLYGFDDGVDFVLINLGTNDWNVIRETTHQAVLNTNTFYQAVVDFTQQIRSTRPQAKIIWLYGMMVGENLFTDRIRQAVSAMGGPQADLYCYTLPTGVSGLLGHPNLEEQQHAGKELESILSELLATYHYPERTQEAHPAQITDGRNLTPSEALLKQTAGGQDSPAGQDGADPVVIGILFALLVLSGGLLALLLSGNKKHRL